MPVVSVSLPTRREQGLAVEAVKHGIEADLIDREDGTSYVDLIGADDKITLVLGKSVEVSVLDRLDKVEHMEPTFTMIGRRGMAE